MFNTGMLVWTLPLGAIRRFVGSPRYPYSSKHTFAKDAVGLLHARGGKYQCLACNSGHISLQLKTELRVSRFLEIITSIALDSFQRA